MRSESTSALGQPSETMPTFFCSGSVVTDIARGPLHQRSKMRYCFEQVGNGEGTSMDLFAVNWLGVVLAALAGFVVGGIWYGPVMGKKWMGAVGLTEEDAKSANMGMVYGCAFAFSLLSSWVLAHTFQIGRAHV